MSNTLPFPLDIEVSGLDEDRAHKVGDHIASIVAELTTFLKLGSLEKIVLTDKYDEALASVDRGFETAVPLKATSEGFATGVAMVVHVKRGDELKCQLIADVSLAAATLFGENETHRTAANATFVHELAHVHDFGMQCTMMPDFMLMHLPRTLEGWLYKVTNPIWSEFFACYIAASVDEAAINSYLEMFLESLRTSPDQIRAEIVAYRSDADLDRLLSVVGERLGLLFKFAGYVIGHLSGLGKTLPEERPQDWGTINELGFAHTWAALVSALTEMFDTYGDWRGLDDYAALGKAFQSYLAEQGISLVPQTRGFYVSIL